MDTAQLEPDSSIRRYIADRKVADPHYSVTAFAIQCGCARQVIYRVLAGDPEVGKNIFDRIEKATGIPSETLYGEWKAERRKATPQVVPQPDLTEPQLVEHKPRRSIARRIQDRWAKDEATAAPAAPQPAPPAPQPKITEAAARRAREFERQTKAAG